MALQFTEYGKGLVLRNLFGTGQTTNISTATNTTNSVPTLAGSVGYNSTYGKNLLIQFYAGTRPDITDTTTLPRAWQGTAYTGTTKLWPQDGVATSAIFSSILAGSDGTNSYIEPTTKYTVDWTNNSITTSASSLASNLLFGAGTVTWFAVYGGFSNSSDVSNWLLAFTGTVGTTGSGADIEMNSTTIPSNNYPVEVKTLSFQYPQPTGVDLIFSKNIYTTALLNSFASGVNGSSTAYLCNLSSAGSANAKYTSSGVNRVLLYSGTRPASPDLAVPVGNTLIGTIDTFNMTWDNFTTFTCTTSEVSLAKTGVTYIGTASAAGTPNWARVLVTNSGSTAAFDCTAGLTSAGVASIQINEAPTVAGQQINLTSMKFTMS